ncbi:hypothetical protein [Glaciecola sp. SC05]
MNPQTEQIDTFNFTQFFANILVLVGLALLPYVVNVLFLIF